jgi:mannitol-1-phosphate 5-dehydrogenase
MKKAIQFGAGNIGRGFIGELFWRSGYEVVFIEVDPKIVAALNAERRYPVRVVKDSGDSEFYVENVRAVNGLDGGAVMLEIVDADILGTAVGVNVLPQIASYLAAGLLLRWRSGNEVPLNIILCENLVDCDAVLKELISGKLGENDRTRLCRLVGFVRASVGRMVPVMTDEMREGNPLRIWVEEYDHLPVDAEGFVGPPLTIFNMETVKPFELYIHRKLYIHNLGHAAAAYFGALKGYRFIWEAILDHEIESSVRSAMEQSARGIAAEHGVPLAPLLDYIDDLVRRFGNRKLGDTIERVGRDLPRKLAARDRLAGAVGLCSKNGLPRNRILDALAAALAFNDPASSTISDLIATAGPREVLISICGFGPSGTDLRYVLDRYAFFIDGRSRLGSAIDGQENRK